MKLLSVIAGFVVVILLSVLGYRTFLSMKDELNLIKFNQEKIISLIEISQKKDEVEPRYKDTIWKQVNTGQISYFSAVAEDGTPGVASVDTLARVLHNSSDTFGTPMSVVPDGPIIEIGKGHYAKGFIVTHSPFVLEKR